MATENDGRFADLVDNATLNIAEAYRRGFQDGLGKKPLPTFFVKPIISKYDGACQVCGKQYHAGETIWWVKDEGDTCSSECAEKFVAKLTLLRS